MRNFKTLVILLSVIASQVVMAQDLLLPVEGYAYRQTAYITLNDGRELEGNLRALKRKKGLVKEVVIVVDGEKLKIEPEEIRFMYVPISGWEKSMRLFDESTDLTRLGNEEIEHELLQEGYAYYENAEMYVKKNKKMTVLAQLLNPHFSKNVKIYHDFFAGETMALRVRGMKVAGGNDKSYFVSINGDTGFKLKKVKYDDMFKEMWKGCPELLAKEKIRWKDFTKDVVTFTDCMNDE